MSDNKNIDEEFYSRQIYTVGMEAMKKIANSSILVSGLGGVGVEIAKNVILCGVKSVTIHDTENTTMNDLGSQFYLNEGSIGKNRASESIEKLRQLNTNVIVEVSTVELNNEFISKFNCIVITSPISYSKIFSLSKFCHENSIAFILAMSRGVFGFIYNDFGDDFIIKEPNARQPSRFLIESISHDEKGIVVLNSQHKNNFSNEDYVTFDQVEGMTELNGKEFPVKFIDFTSFSIGDTSQFHPYENTTSSGYCTQIFKPKTKHFKELNEALRDPIFYISDYSEKGREKQVIISFFSLFKAIEENDTSVENILKNAKIFNDEFKLADTINEKFIREFVREDTVLSPTAAVIGGIAGQESIKSISSKFIPFDMFYTMSDIEALQPVSESNFNSIKGDRYDGYRLVFGDAQFEAMAKLNYFMVGSGALGCELLKNWAMMGVSTMNGKIYVTDMDRIEKSNLNRQFLFHDDNIGEFKSVCASNAAKAMNPDINIEAHTIFVGETSESFYNYDFYSKLSGICNAIDNVQARLYNDEKAIFYRKPLLESGTHGTTGSTQIVVPHLTISYSSTNPKKTDDEEYNLCTIHSFPTNINHCATWALDKFVEIFQNDPNIVNNYINNPEYVNSMINTQIDLLIGNLTIIKELLTYDCVKIARLLFDNFFYKDIKDLITKYPKNSINEQGEPFWRGDHRFPTPIEYDASNDLHASFIKAATKLLAKMHNIEISDEQIQNSPQLAQNVEITYEHFQNSSIENTSTTKPPQTLKKKKTTKKKKATKKKESIGRQKKENKVRDLCTEISPFAKKENILLEQSFEKDNNAHIDFIAASANIRANNYRIQNGSTFEIKRVAGKIVPAISTTTAAVCGFVCLEMFKVHSVTKKVISDFKNCNIYLSDGTILLCTPEKAETRKIAIRDSNQNIIKEYEFTFWDKWIIEGDLTPNELVELFKKKYGLNALSLSIGQNLIFPLLSPDMDDYTDNKITYIYQNVSKLKLLPGKMIPLTLGFNDDAGNIFADILPEIYLKYW